MLCRCKRTLEAGWPWLQESAEDVPCAERSSVSFPRPARFFLLLRFIQAHLPSSAFLASSSPGVDSNKTLTVPHYYSALQVFVVVGTRAEESELSPQSPGGWLLARAPATEGPGLGPQVVRAKHPQAGIAVLVPPAPRSPTAPTGGLGILHLAPGVSTWGYQPLMGSPSEALPPPRGVTCAPALSMSVPRHSTDPQ